METLMNDITVGLHRIRRAYEVALTNDVALYLVTDEVTVHYGEAVAKAFNSSIKDFDVKCVFVCAAESINDYGLKVSLTQEDVPEFNQLFGKYESLDTVVKRADAAIRIKKDIPLRLDSSGQALLKSGYERLGSNPLIVQQVMYTAQAIAALDNSKLIQAAHLAEAMQYYMNKIN